MSRKEGPLSGFYKPLGKTIALNKESVNLSVTLGEIGDGENSEVTGLNLK